MHLPINPLKQARMNADLSLQDMAYLLDVDVSNLSKYERGVKSAPLHICLGYHLLTKSSLSKLFFRHVQGVIQLVSHRITSLIEELEQEQSTAKLKSRIERLYESLNNISCLHDVSKDDHE